MNGVHLHPTVGTAVVQVDGHTSGEVDVEKLLTNQDELVHPAAGGGRGQPQLKLTKRRRDGYPAAAFWALDHLRIDLGHLSGGKTGDCHIYMFNSKVRFLVYISGCRVIRYL